MRVPHPSALVIRLGLCAGACDNANDARRPSVPTAPGRPVDSHDPILITSGADGRPVAGARVLINGDEFSSAGTGHVDPDLYSGGAIGAEIDVDAKGVPAPANEAHGVPCHHAVAGGQRPRLDVKGDDPSGRNFARCRVTTRASLHRSRQRDRSSPG